MSEKKRKREVEEMENGASKRAPSEPLRPNFLSERKEDLYGIHLFRSPGASFSCALKHRLSDFIVKEVDVDGNVATVTEATQRNDEVFMRQKSQLTEEQVTERLNEVLSAERVAPLLEFLRGLRTQELGEDEFNIGVLEKSGRTVVYETLKNSVYKEVVAVNTIKQDEGSALALKRVDKDSIPKSDGKRKKKNWSAANPWPKDRQFLKFSLSKANRDVNESLGFISRFTNVKPKYFTVAGMKDKRGVTSQWYAPTRGNLTPSKPNSIHTNYRMTVKRMSPVKLEKVNQNSSLMRTGNYSYVEKKLRLGDLKGNKFKIALRFVEASEPDIRQNMEQLQKRGFINYFGLQRFGTSAVPTCDIGKAVLKEDWDALKASILAPRGGEDAMVTEIRKKLSETNDYEAALNSFPHRFVAERQLLTGLLKNNGSVPAAFKTISRTLRLLYFHAYQSLVWNKCASRRLEVLDADHAVVGDLVIGRDATAPVAVTEDTVDQYTIEDVVLPIPGTSTVYPANEIGDYFVQLMKGDGVYEVLRTAERQKKFDMDLPGGYRKLIIRTEVEYSVKEFSRRDETVLSDDEMVYQELKETDGGGADPSTEQQKLRALCLEFFLPSSSYATMLVREISKQVTVDMV